MCFWFLYVYVSHPFEHPSTVTYPQAHAVVGKAHALTSPRTNKAAHNASRPHSLAEHTPSLAGEAHKARSMPHFVCLWVTQVLTHSLAKLAHSQSSLSHSLCDPSLRHAATHPPTHDSLKRSQKQLPHAPIQLSRLHTHPLTLGLTHLLTHSLTHEPTDSLTSSLTDSHTHSRTRSLTHELTHSHAHSLTHSHAHSLTH